MKILRLLAALWLAWDSLIGIRAIRDAPPIEDSYPNIMRPGWKTVFAPLLLEGLNGDVIDGRIYNGHLKVGMFTTLPCTDPPMIQLYRSQNVTVQYFHIVPPCECVDHPAIVVYPAKGVTLK